MSKPESTNSIISAWMEIQENINKDLLQRIQSLTYKHNTSTSLTKSLLNKIVSYIEKSPTSSSLENLQNQVNHLTSELSSLKQVLNTQTTNTSHNPHNPTHNFKPLKNNPKANSPLSHPPQPVLDQLLLNDPQPLHPQIKLHHYFTRTPNTPQSDSSTQPPT